MGTESPRSLLASADAPQSHHEDAACEVQREPDFPETNVPEPAQRLLREHVFTFEQLGALLYLHEHKGKASTVPELAKVLRIRAQSAREALDWLVSKGLVFQESTAPPAFTYGASSPKLEACVEALVRACVEDRLGVLQLMGAFAIERTRANLHKAFWGRVPS